LLLGQADVNLRSASHVFVVLSAPGLFTTIPGAIPWKGGKPMRDYELVLIANADLDEGALNDVINKVKVWITDGNGEVSKIDLWGKRRLAYPIRKQSDGIYVVFNLAMPPALGATLERNLRFTEPVMRFLLVAK
jgi:small subunit ribosomal protein S6